jgi:hypothetical protein
VVATYGRGFWILDDITPLQQLDTKVLSSAAHLFPPRTAYRFLTRPTLPIYMGEEFDPPSVLGHNPPYGASINYYLKEALSGDVEVEIADSEGRSVRKLKEAGAGHQPPLVGPEVRVLEYRLRTSPVGHPEIGLKAEGWTYAGPESGGVTARGSPRNIQ